MKGMGGTLKEWEELRERVITCHRCPRLVAYREQTARLKKPQFKGEDYWGKPVMGFGDLKARILIVGLAPAPHGANRTGRMFTGDGSAQTLMKALHQIGLASQPFSLHRSDGLKLWDVYLTAVCRCAPPKNKPTPSEVKNCLPYLAQEFLILKRVRVIVALGQIAFKGLLDALKLLASRQNRLWDPPKPSPKFSHGAHFVLTHPLGGTLHLLASYHPSRQNTQTGRLTLPMLLQVLQTAKELSLFPDSYQSPASDEPPFKG